MTKGRREEAASVLAVLRAEADEMMRHELSERYGIDTPKAFGIPMRRMKAMAKPLAPDHELAQALWVSGWYEARIIASLVDDPAMVTTDQMQRWCLDFDNWAIVDSVCFNHFDRAPQRWSLVGPWAADEREFVKRAAFALLWALALHDRRAPDSAFSAALPLIEANSNDERPLVTKALTMSLRAVGKSRPGLRPQVLALAERLAASDDPPSRRVGRPVVKALA
jgi:3-methyladenine DNA glycosylase AlkD